MPHRLALRPLVSSLSTLRSRRSRSASPDIDEGPNNDDKKPKPANRKPLESRIKRLEEMMTRLNARKSEIDARLVDPAIYQDAEALKVALHDQAYVARELGQVEAEWLQKQAELERS